MKIFIEWLAQLGKYVFIDGILLLLFFQLLYRHIDKRFKFIAQICQEKYNSGEIFNL